MCVRAHVCSLHALFCVLALPGGDVIPVFQWSFCRDLHRGSGEHCSQMMSPGKQRTAWWTALPGQWFHILCCSSRRGVTALRGPPRASAIPARERLFFEYALPETPSALCIPVLPDMVGAPSYHLKTIWEPRRRQHPQQKKPSGIIRCVSGSKHEGEKDAPSLNP